MNISSNHEWQITVTYSIANVDSTVDGSIATGIAGVARPESVSKDNNSLVDVISLHGPSST